MRAHLQAHFDAKGLGAVPEPKGAASEVSREHLSMLMRAKPQMVSFHFGLPHQEVIDAIKAAGIFIISSATTVAEARMLEQRGVDAIIAQGTEPADIAAPSPASTSACNRACSRCCRKWWMR